MFLLQMHLCLRSLVYSWETLWKTPYPPNSGYVTLQSWILFGNLCLRIGYANDVSPAHQITHRATLPFPRSRPGLPRDVGTEAPAGPTTTQAQELREPIPPMQVRLSRHPASWKGGSTDPTPCDCGTRRGG